MQFTSLLIWILMLFPHVLLLEQCLTELMKRRPIMLSRDSDESGFQVGQNCLDDLLYTFLGTLFA